MGPNKELIFLTSDARILAVTTSGIKVATLHFSHITFAWPDSKIVPATLDDQNYFSPTNKEEHNAIVAQQLG